MKERLVNTVISHLSAMFPIRILAKKKSHLLMIIYSVLPSTLNVLEFHERQKQMIGIAVAVQQH